MKGARSTKADSAAGAGRPEVGREDAYGLEGGPASELEGAREGSAAPSAGPDEGTSAPPVRADLSLRTVKEIVKGIPRFGVLLFRLLGDDRVSLLDRALFGFTLAYLFVPVDLVPDWLLGFGELDDLFLMLLALDRLLYRTDRDVLLEHWDGDRTPLLLVTDLLERAADRLPRWARGLLRAG